MVWKFESIDNKFKHGRLMVPSDTSWNDFLEVVTFENILNSRTLNDTFSRNLKRCFGSWHCWENIAIKDAKRYILREVETLYWEVELLGNVEIKDAKRCILTLFETMFWKLELRRNFWNYER